MGLSLLMVAIGLVWIVLCAFLISRRLHDMYGTAQGWAAKKAIRDDTMKPLRYAMQFGSAIVVFGLVLFVKAL